MSQEPRQVQVCFSPALYPNFRNKEAVAVVVDILRATSAICEAFKNGAASIIPVGTLEEARAFLSYLGSAESQKSAVEVMGRIVTNGEVDPAIYDEMTQKGIELMQGADFVAQFYDRDTTPEMADEGMNAMMAFWDDPSQIDDLLAQLEEARQRIFAEEQE